MKEINFEVVINYLKSRDYDEDFNNDLISITEGIKHNFNSDYDLGYLLQLMTNAYITEKYTLRFLNDYTYWDAISNELAKAGYWGAPSSIYRFNNIPNNHNVYSADLTKSFSSDAEYYDIFGDDHNEEDRESYKIDVKATTSDKIESVTNFHNADIIFIYELDTKKLYFKYKELLGGYSDFIYLDTISDLDTLQIKFVDNKFLIK